MTGRGGDRAIEGQSGTEIPLRLASYAGQAGAWGKGKIPDTGFRIPDFRYQGPDAAFRIPVVENRGDWRCETETGR